MMIRIARFGLVASFALLVTGALSAQQTGQPGGQAGQAGKQAGGQAGQTGGQTGQAGKAQTGQTGGQTGQTGQTGGQTGQQGQGGFTYRGFSQTPFFSDPSVRKQLNLNDEQYNKLNQAYGQAWNQFQSGSSQLNNLPEQQRSQRMNQNWGQFNSTVHKTANDILDPQSRGRFNQLWNQYRGYETFNDPEIQQKLNLTDEQRQKFQQASQDYYNQSQNTSGLSQEQLGQRWTQGRQKMNENINNILNEQQRQTWRTMTGDPYQFQYQSGGSQTTNPGGGRQQDRK